MADVQHVAFQLPSPTGEVIYGDVYHPQSNEVKPVVVVCHGFKGFKDWGTWPVWGQHLAEQGLVAVLFNFSHNGIGAKQMTEFTRLDLFANHTLRYEIQDLNAVLDALVAGALPAAAHMDVARLGLMGHSRGGGTVVVQAGQDARIKALATWNAVADFMARFSVARIQDWTSQGYSDIPNARTGQIMRLNRIFYEDALAHAAALDIQAAARRLDIPWLILHAEDDEAVAFSEGQALHLAQPKAQFIPMRGGHTFGGRHPFVPPIPEPLAHAWAHTTEFFKAHL